MTARITLALLIGCASASAQSTTTYSFPNTLQLACCSPLTYGFTNLIHDSTISGANLQVASITVSASAAVMTTDPYGVAGFDWTVSIAPQPFGSPAGQQTGGNPGAITSTAPTQLHTAQAGSTTAGATVNFKTTYNFRSGALTDVPTGHMVANADPVMNFSSGLYIQVFAWTGDTNAVMTLSNIQVSVTLAAPLIPTTTTIQSSANPATFGHPLTLSATVSPAAATGEVTFYDGLSLVGDVKINSGIATLTTALLPSGVGSLHATYGGNAIYSGSSSQAIFETVTALPEDGFEPSVNFVSGIVNPTGLVVADFNEDGHADLATADFYGTGVVLLGNGDGTFQPPATFSAGPDSQGIVTGDFNGDGHADVAVSNGYNFLFIITVLLGNGDGTFQPGVTYMTGQSPAWMAVGDFNGDGIADLAVSNNLNSNVSILLGQSNGIMQGPFNYVVGATSGAFGTSPGPIAVGDFNGDGRPDLFVCDDGGFSVLFGNGDGTFEQAKNETGACGHLVFVGDFNGDGRADLVINSPSPGSPPVSLVMLGNGDGTFQAPVAYPLAVVAVGDFDGNGKPDLLAASSFFDDTTGVTEGSVSVMFGKGDGTFQASSAAYPGRLNPDGPFVVGDFNGDGRSDLALTFYEQATSTTGTGYIGVMLGIPSATVPSVFGPAISTGGVLNAASFAKNAQGLGAAVAPGSLVQIYGNFPGAMTAAAGTAPYPTLLGGVSASFNGTAAPLSQVSPAGQYPFINAQVPFEVQAAQPATATVMVNGTASSSQSVQIVPAAPGIFTIPPNGTGNAIMVFTDPVDNIVKIAAPTGASIGYPTAPVPRGQAAFFYVTGLGAMTPPVADGDSGLEAPVVAHNANATPVVMVGGITAEVQFAGQAPGYPGVNQINIVIPQSAPTGDQVPVQVISADGSVMSNTATIAIR